MIRRPWVRGILWLLVLGPFFFVSYNWANQWAADRAADGGVTSIVFAWEHVIPFLPWTIVPYWSIDVLYGLSLLICRSRRGVDRQAFRLLTAQLIAVVCFTVFPLRYSFVRPEFIGETGATPDVLAALYRELERFDLPFNQAPSLHIALLVILWDGFARRLAYRGAWYWAMNIWFALIAVSVLTTFQHHFVDVPTGALLGWFCVWLWPVRRKDSPLFDQPCRRLSSGSVRIGAVYFAGAAVCAALAIGLGGVYLWLLWPAVSLALVALFYFRLGAAGFQKRGRSPGLAVRWLLAPYLCGARFNAWLWTRASRQPDEVEGGVWLGAMPSQREMVADRFVVLVDLTAELCAPRGNWRHIGLPWLDLLPPDEEQLRQAAQIIENERRRGGSQPILVCCALGYSRSACAVAAWLLATGRTPSVAAALIRLAGCRPRIRLGGRHRAALEAIQPRLDAPGVVKE